MSDTLTIAEAVSAARSGLSEQGAERRQAVSVLLCRKFGLRHLEDLNLLLAAGSREEQNRVINGRTQSIGAGMIAEREYLLPPGRNA